MAEKKAGRPTNNPKGKSIHVRLDKDSERVLDEYCTQEQLSRAEGIRKGIMKLESDIKK